MPENPKKVWEKYCEEHVSHVRPLLTEFGFGLAKEQPHLSGERFLMRAVTTENGKKLVLLGTENKTGKSVVIKVAEDASGKKELRHERLCRDMMQHMKFSYSVFASPKELLFTERNGYLICVYEFLSQEKPFVTRPIEEQFSIALLSFKAQEGAHAATYEHIRRVEKTFGRRTTQQYLDEFSHFQKDIEKTLPNEIQLKERLLDVKRVLQTHIDVIEQYGDFLTHTDFVPHNFRVMGNTVYLLDHSSLRFGNKYEGWARFINFMELYNPQLAEALVAYVRNNRTPEESLSLKLMRLYRLGEIIRYYAGTLQMSSGDLLTLNQARITWWTHVLASVLEDKVPATEVREQYLHQRDTLRSQEEQERQKDLH